MYSRHWTTRYSTRHRHAGAHTATVDALDEEKNWQFDVLKQETSAGQKLQQLHALICAGNVEKMAGNFIRQTAGAAGNIQEGCKGWYGLAGIVDDNDDVATNCKYFMAAKADHAHIETHCTHNTHNTTVNNHKAAINVADMVTVEEQYESVIDGAVFRGAENEVYVVQIDAEVAG
ncbi:hypothetical protein E3N88_29623 [Mikania micrantha]|uniref:Uncharacterized protein n=1 Tax=Mikania micrantha TaxID=192012 RepID=A0A5N6MJJ9_9ASTR|nr:hypothetical protein E3N88_29623 [Mikania micrantha]